MKSSPFSRDHAPAIGQPETLTDNIIAVTAPNAGPMTFTGTRSYVVGTSDLAVIDPGPMDEDHLAALMAAIDDRAVKAICVTHAHLDHSPLAARLSKATGAKVYACSPELRQEDNSLNLGDLGGGEGVDAGFQPDIALNEGDIIEGQGWRLEALHTPGHLDDHLCFSTGEALFSGDHVMGWASTMISPPQGSLTAFMKSLRSLRKRTENTYYSGHGDVINNPNKVVEHLIEHRLFREAQIVAALKEQSATISELTSKIYHDVDKKLHRAASRNVLAHLIDLYEREKLTVEGEFSLDAVFRLSKKGVEFS